MVRLRSFFLALATILSLLSAAVRVQAVDVVVYRVHAVAEAGGSQGEGEAPSLEAHVDGGRVPAVRPGKGPDGRAHGRLRAGDVPLLAVGAVALEITSGPRSLRTRAMRRVSRRRRRARHLELMVLLN